jgi:hypothetical protein
VRRWWRALVVGIAIVLAVAPLPAGPIDRWYSSGIYPLLQSAITGASNLVPFAMFDLLVLVTIAWLLWRTIADVRAGRRRRWARVPARAVVRIATAAAIFYLVFLAVWGLNYRRVALERKLAFDSGRVSPRRAREVALAAVSEANTLYGEAHAHDADRFDMAALARAFADGEHDLGITHRARPARPKRTMFDLYFRRAAIDGMTDPFFLETFTVSDLLPFERPFVVAHEWAHLAGLADESEANFAGWVACLRGGGLERYSGWLFLYSEIVGRLPRTSAIEVSARLDAGPRADLRAVADRVRRQVNPRVSTAGWRVYDSYLKANRVQAGTASYSQVVRLVLGTEFDEAWKPKLSATPQ